MVIYPLMGSSTSPIHISNNISSSLLQLQQFCHVCLSHVPRNGNKASHALAQHEHLRFITWIEETPCIIEHIVAQDVLFLKAQIVQNTIACLDPQF